MSTAVLTNNWLCLKNSFSLPNLAFVSFTKYYSSSKSFLLCHSIWTILNSLANIYIRIFCSNLSTIFSDYHQRPTTHWELQLLPVPFSNHSCTLCLFGVLRHFVTYPASIGRHVCLLTEVKQNFILHDASNLWPQSLQLCKLPSLNLY